jgi:hypothetical protein
MSVKEQLRKELPLLLSAGAVGGFLTGAVLAIKATPAANQKLSAYAEIEALEPRQRVIDKGKIIFRYYGPSIGLFLISTAMVVYSNDLYRKRNAAVSFALYSANRMLRRWEETVADKVSAKAFDEIRAETRAPKDPPAEEFVPSADKSLIYDVFSDRYFTVQSVDTILRAVADVNLRIRSDDFVPINEFYSELGLKPLAYGEELGWHSEHGPMEIEISSALVRDTYTPCVSIYFSTEPRNADGRLAL